VSTESLGKLSVNIVVNNTLDSIGVYTDVDNLGKREG